METASTPNHKRVRKVSTKKDRMAAANLPNRFYDDDGNACRNPSKGGRIDWTPEIRFALAIIEFHQAIPNIKPRDKWVRVAAVFVRVFKKEVVTWGYEGTDFIKKALEEQFRERSDPLRSKRWLPTEDLHQAVRDDIIKRIGIAETECFFEGDSGIIDHTLLPYDPLNTPLPPVTPFDAEGSKRAKEEAKRRAEQRKGAGRVTSQRVQRRKEGASQRTASDDFPRTQSDQEDVVMENSISEGEPEAVENDLVSSDQSESAFIPFAAPTGVSLDDLAARALRKLSFQDTVTFFQQAFPSAQAIDIVGYFLDHDNNTTNDPIEVFQVFHHKTQQVLPLGGLLEQTALGKAYRQVNNVSKAAECKALMMVHRKQVHYHDNTALVDCSLVHVPFVATARDPIYVAGGEIVRLTLFDPLSEHSSVIDAQLCGLSNCSVCNSQLLDSDSGIQHSDGLGPFVHASQVHHDGEQHTFCPDKQGPTSFVPGLQKEKLEVAFWDSVERDVGVCDWKVCITCNNIEDVQQELFRRALSMEEI